MSALTWTGIAVVVLLLWISSWSIIDLSIAHFLPNYWSRMTAFTILLLVAVMLLLVLLKRAPEQTKRQL